MKTFIIKSNFKYEIKANNKKEAMQQFVESIEDELGISNITLINEFMESLIAKEIK